MQLNMENAQSIANKGVYATFGSLGISQFLTDNMQVFMLSVAAASLAVSIFYYIAKLRETKRFNNETLKIQRERLDMDKANNNG